MRRGRAVSTSIPLWAGLLGVALGSAVGGMLRHAVSGWVARRIGETFPWGTLIVNVSGAFAIGMMAGAYTARGIAPAASWPWLLLVTGVLGSYTTVSSLSLQTLLLARDGAKRRAAVYLGASLLLGGAAVAIGEALGARL
jgi:CrcB protein